MIQSIFSWRNSSNLRIWTFWSFFFFAWFKSNTFSLTLVWILIQLFESFQYLYKNLIQSGTYALFANRTFHTKTLKNNNSYANVKWSRKSIPNTMETSFHYYFFFCFFVIEINHLLQSCLFFCSFSQNTHVYWLMIDLIHLIYESWLFFIRKFLVKSFYNHWNKMIKFLIQSGYVCALQAPNNRF